MTILVLCLFCVVVLRSFLEASDEASDAKGRNENHWVLLQDQQSKLDAQVTKDGGVDHCMTANPDLMRNLASLHLQNGDCQKSAEIYSKLWTADKDKPAADNGSSYNHQFVDDALALAGVYQAQGSHMESISCYKTILEYDMARLDKKDPIIARDFNNLGVAYYLAANTKKDLGKRRELFDVSVKMYTAASAIAEQSKAPFLVSTVRHNGQLTFRDLSAINP